MLDLHSPNSVLANALNRTIDVLRARVALKRPKLIRFYVGTQINGAPHIGTHLTQAAAFVLAQHVRRAYSIDTQVVFHALDNAPHEIKLDPESHRAYQITFFHALGAERIRALIDEYYTAYFERLAARTDVEYVMETYSTQQATAPFRGVLLRTLQHIEKVRWCVSPASGLMPIRLPCPKCHWAEKRGERTRLLNASDAAARFEAFCFDHLEYEIEVAPSSPAYIDLNTLYRNVVKEASLCSEEGTLSVMVKGGDWAFACQPVDWALGLLGEHSQESPMRLFTPQVISETGAKLSKSLIGRGESDPLPSELGWVLNPTTWPRGPDDYLDRVLWMLDGLLADPKHFFRAYSYNEIARFMNAKPRQSDNDRARVMYIYRKYYDMIASGQKTIELRVGYSSMKRIRRGELIRFACQDDATLTRVVRVATYKSFDDVFANEEPARINPEADVGTQLTEVRKIFPADKEALGVLAIEVQRIEDGGSEHSSGV